MAFKTPITNINYVYAILSEKAIHSDFRSNKAVKDGANPLTNSDMVQQSSIIYLSLSTGIRIMGALRIGIFF